MYERFERWLDEKLEEGLPEHSQAVNFNLYEEEDGFSIQLIASDRFDSEDDEWACYELYSSGEDIFFYENEDGWEAAQTQAIGLISEYLEKGRFAGTLLALKGIAAGFIDGDLVYIYRREAEE